MYRKCSKKARPWQKAGKLSFLIKANKKRIIAHTENMLERNKLFDVDVAKPALHLCINRPADVQTAQLQPGSRLLLRQPGCIPNASQIFAELTIFLYIPHSEAPLKLIC